MASYVLNMNYSYVLETLKTMFKFVENKSKIRYSVCKSESECLRIYTFTDNSFIDKKV